MESATRDIIARGATGRPPAADADLSRRPGVPIYKPSGTSARAARPALDQQTSDVKVLVGVDVGRLTPVFGTAAPPRGLSGLIRRLAYRIPEHTASRWMLLLFGDRVDVWESRVRRHPLLFGIAAAAMFGGLRARRRTGRTIARQTTRRVRRLGARLL